MKHRDPASRRRSTSAAKPPKTLHAELRARRNRAVAAQTRKVLARHYAARYRVR